MIKSIMVFINLFSSINSEININIYEINIFNIKIVVVYYLLFNSTARQLLCLPILTTFIAKD